MTIGEYIAQKQLDIYRKLIQTYRIVQWESLEKIALLMQEIPGFYQDERLPR